MEVCVRLKVFVLFTHITEEEEQLPQEKRTTAFRRAEDEGKEGERKVCVWPKEAERKGLKDTEMRGTVYSAVRLRLQNREDERRRAGEGLKVYRPVCAIASYII